MSEIKTFIQQAAIRRMAILLAQADALNQEAATEPPDTFFYATLILDAELKLIKVRLWAAVGGIDLEADCENNSAG